MKLAQKQGKTNKIGALGEAICQEFLKNKGFSIIATNFSKPWGEIDIIAEKNKTLHFIEVKSVSYETKLALESAVSHGTWQPEEQVHHFKLQKLSRIIETWLMERDWQGEWQIDVAAIHLVPREIYAKVKYIPNIIEE